MLNGAEESEGRPSPLSTMALLQMKVHLAEDGPWKAARTKRSERTPVEAPRRENAQWHHFEFFSSEIAVGSGASNGVVPEVLFYHVQSYCLPVP
jgi:hypothetical protein